MASKRTSRSTREHATQPTSGRLDGATAAVGDGPGSPASAATERAANATFLVGIGASAGGLEALREFVQQLDAGAGISYVVAQHLSPSHRSMLVDLLSRETRLTVADVTHGEQPRPDVIYVTPFRSNVRFEQGRFVLADAPRATVPKPSINELFISLAQTLGEMAIGVILSGTGTDGALGMRAIHDAGGLTLVQEPATAKYDGMPRASLETGCIDQILAPGLMGRRLEAIVRRLRSDEPLIMHGDAPGTALERIVRAVRRNTGLDLGLYKPSSFERRLRRRLVATGSSSIDAYVDMLERTPTEIERLAREMFVSVTSFFRDTEAFEALDRELAALLAAQDDPAELRIWVPGCASGEEAYSVAMLVRAQLDALGRGSLLRIFATDLDQVALKRARRGVYPTAAIAAIPEPHRSRCFDFGEDDVRITKRIRDSVIFSEHDITRDPPFLRLDLISCRNLLIYLQPSLQMRLLASFATALRNGGLLFLGKAEGVHGCEELFTPAQEQQRIFRRTGSGTRERSVQPTRPPPPVRVPPRADAYDVSSRLLQALGEGLVPPTVVVEGHGRIRHVLGDVSPFLKLASGEATFDLYRNAVKPLRNELRSLLLHAQRSDMRRSVRRLDTHELGHALSLSVTRLAGQPHQPDLFAIGFEQLEIAVPQPTEADPARDARIDALEEALGSTREHLHTVIEELENSNEELQSLNEEMQSANEELQSANEELETSNEELQSTNEELITVNEELETRTHELTLLATDLQNVKDSLLDPLIVVDEHRRVVLFNPPAQLIFALGPSATGTDLFSHPCQIEVGNLAADIATVVEQRSVIERQIDGARCYLLRVQPYINASAEAKGAVLSFHENTEEIAAEATRQEYARRLDEAHRFITATLDALTFQVCVIDERGTLVSTNASWDASMTARGGVPDRCAAGANYLKTCRVAVNAGYAPAAVILAGIEDVIAGRRPFYECEYPCHTPDAEAWYAMRVTSFPDDGPRFFVICHEDISARKESEARIRLQSTALDQVGNGICIADARQPGLPFIYVNRAFESITGYRAEEVLGQTASMLRRGDPTQEGISRLRAAIQAGQQEQVLVRNQRKNGEPFWNELTVTPIVEDGEVTRWLGVQHDVTSLLASREALEASMRREKLAMAFAGIGSFEYNVRQGVITLSLLHWRMLGQRDDGDELPFRRFVETLHAEDQTSFEDALKVCLAGHSNLDLEYRAVWADGSVHWLHTRGNAVLDQDGVAQRVLGLSQDITERKSAEEQVRFIAHHDALTGLPNRALLRDRLQLAINRARRERTRLALLFIDLDHFKHINDTLGHEVGDALLVSVARRLQTSVRDTDTICRQGGDEFIVALPGVRDSNEVAHITGKVLDAISQPMQLLGHEIQLTCSIGVSLYPDDGTHIDELLRHADTAMYHVKGHGRNSLEFFAQPMNDELTERMSIIGPLRKAIANGDLELHYQPMFALATNELVGIEALLRWHHPTRGLLKPDAFITLAEESGLIVEIGEWVLREACRQNRAWFDAGVCKVPVAVNLSAAQLRYRNIIEKVTMALAASGLPPGLLELELTERAIVHNPEGAGELLAGFRAQGIRLALDDFGTGYSSLSHLHRFPVDKLKVDRSFVCAAPGDKSAETIVRGIISLARGLGVAVIAEGIETDAQRQFLSDEACWGFQGYYAIPPLPAHALPEALSAYAARVATGHSALSA